MLLFIVVGQTQASFTDRVGLGHSRRLLHHWLAEAAVLVAFAFIAARGHHMRSCVNEASLLKNRCSIYHGQGLAYPLRPLRSTRCHSCSGWQPCSQNHWTSTCHSG